MKPLTVHWCVSTLQFHGQYHSFRWVQGQTCIIKPLLQQWFEFAHVFKAQVQGLKAWDGSLAEIISIQLAHGQANISLMKRQKTKRVIKKTKRLRLYNPHLYHWFEIEKKLQNITRRKQCVDFYTHLCEAQFNTSLFEGLGKLFQFFQITGLL